jgi:hypothetical protein
MRTLATVVGLTLFALAPAARAQEAAPPPGTAAPAADAAALSPPPAVATPAPPAANVAAAPAPAPPAAAAPRKLEVGLAFLPMGLGKYINSPDTTTTVTREAAFAYGFGLSAGYEVIPHLVVGLAPQFIFNVKEKAPITPTAATREYDLMARVAYVLKAADGTAVYAEVLPGYSLINTDAKPKGFVIAFGLGGAIQMTDRVFVNVGAGYQMGFQKWSEGANSFQTRTRYLRVALGGGVRF